MSILSVVGEIDRCGKAFAALAEIERLHAPVEVCTGCHLRECPGDCDWAGELDDDDPRTVTVCSACCWDDRDNARSEDCILTHQHDTDGPACATAEIVARAER